MYHQITGMIPWGSYRPSGLYALLIWICHRIPGYKFLEFPAFLLRRPVKYATTGPIDVFLWGLKMRLHPQGNVAESRILFLPNFFDRDERLFLKKRLAPDCIFLDVGANAGGYTFWIYSCFGKKCRIITVEPDPELQRRLLYNIEINEAKNIYLEPSALGNIEGEGLLSINRVNRGENKLLSSDAKLKGDITTVRVKTLKKLVAEQGITRIDALKIDIEGNEWDVLEPFFRAVNRRVWPRLLIMEFLGFENQSRLISLLNHLGYRTRFKNRMNYVWEYPEN